MEIQHALYQKRTHKTPKSKPTSTAIIQYMPTVSGRFSRFLAKYNIRTIHWPVKKNSKLLRLAKDDLGYNVPGIYHIPCECNKVYIGQTGRMVTASCKEHDCTSDSINQRSLQSQNIS